VRPVTPGILRGVARGGDGQPRATRRCLGRRFRLCGPLARHHCGSARALRAHEHHLVHRLDEDLLGDERARTLDAAGHEHAIDVEPEAGFAVLLDRPRSLRQRPVVLGGHLEGDLDLLLDDSDEDVGRLDDHFGREGSIEGGGDRDAAPGVETRRHERVGDGASHHVEPDRLSGEAQHDGDGVTDHDGHPVRDGRISRRGDDIGITDSYVGLLEQGPDGVGLSLHIAGITIDYQGDPLVCPHESGDAEDYDEYCDESCDEVVVTKESCRTNRRISHANLP
jgi:hypothetical protein